MDQLKVYRILSDRILTREYPPNYVLKATAIAKELGVSATPVREAFIWLEADGLIDRTRNSSPVVTVPQFDTVREALNIRHQLAPLVARLVMKFLNEDLMAEVEKILEETRNTKDLKKLMALDARFHNALNTATRSALLVEILEKLRLQMQRLWLGETDEARYAAQRLEDYELCLSALRERNEEKLAALLQSHQRRFVQELRASLLDELGAPGG